MPQNQDINRLLRVCELGDESGLQLLLDSGYGVNSKDENGTTPLHVAAANDHFVLVSFLLFNGGGIDVCNSSGWTALHHACFHGHNQTIKILIKSRASLTLRNKFGATPLNVAVASGHNSTVRLLLEAGAPVDEDFFPNCLSSVATASLYGYLSILHQLLASQKSSSVKKLVNLSNVESEWTPMMLAAAVGSKAAVQCLLERGADPNDQNRLGECAIEIAISCGNEEVVAFLRDKTSFIKRSSQEEKISDIQELFGACKIGDVFTVAKLLETRFALDVNVTDSSGATPLMLAALTGNLEIIERLVQKGARLNTQDSANGWTALMQAVFYGHREAVKFLLEQGADPTLRAHNGFTSFDLATLVEETDSSLIRILGEETCRGKMLKKSKQEEADALANKGLRAWWAKMGKRFRSLSNSDFESSVVPYNNSQNGGSSRSLDNISRSILKYPVSPVNEVGKMSLTDLTRSQSFLTSKRLTSNSLTIAHPPLFATEGFRKSTLPEGITRSDLKKFLPLVDTRALLKKYCVSNKIPADGLTSTRASNSAQESGNRRKKQQKASINKSKLLVRPTSFSDFRPRTLSPPRNRRARRNDVIDGPRDVKDLLLKLSLEKYIAAFKAHEVDLEAFVELNEADLVEIGVDKPGARRKLLAEINKLR